VEHLLRDINDPSTSTLALQIKQKINGLTGLARRLVEIRDYLEKIISGRIPINNQITYNLQNIFNLLPNLNMDELVKSMVVKTNDMHLVIYLSSLVRSVIALHGLLNNKIKYKDVDDVLDRSAGVEMAEPQTNPTEKKDKVAVTDGEEKSATGPGESKSA
jgi:26S proteasome regulatory subunit N8